jgi:hypothetical protein
VLHEHCPVAGSHVPLPEQDAALHKAHGCVAQLSCEAGCAAVHNVATTSAPLPSVHVTPRVRVPTPQLLLHTTAAHDATPKDTRENGAGMLMEQQGVRDCVQHLQMPHAVTRQPYTSHGSVLHARLAAGFAPAAAHLTHHQSRGDVQDSHERGRECVCVFVCVCVRER